MSRKRNTFSKAVKHLKSSKIEEKLQTLNEIPTMNTSGLYDVVPGALSRTEIDKNNPTLPDYSGLDWDVDGEDGRDTSGLFDGEGNSLFVTPPGDNSYILGPMASMFYNYAYNDWTMIGYIRESDRRFVNLGYLYQNRTAGSEFSGRLEDWDGVNDFNSYGQLTLEQALWFKNTPKKGGTGSSGHESSDFRAFYPGPPSSTPDAFGRYYCTIVGTPKATKDNTRTVAPMDMQGSDNFSAIQSLIKQFGKNVRAVYKGGKLVYDRYPKIDPEGAAYLTKKAKEHGLSDSRIEEILADDPGELLKFVQMQDKMQSIIDNSDLISRANKESELRSIVKSLSAQQSEIGKRTGHKGTEYYDITRELNKVIGELNKVSIKTSSERKALDADLRKKATEHGLSSKRTEELLADDPEKLLNFVRMQDNLQSYIDKSEVNKPSVLRDFGNQIKDWGNKFKNWKGIDGKGLTMGEKSQYAQEVITTAFRLAAAVPSGNRAMQTFRSVNDPTSKDFGKHTPGHVNYTGPKELEMSSSDRTHISTQLNKGLIELGIDTSTDRDLTNAEIEKISDYMAKGESGVGGQFKGPDRSMPFYVTFWSLPPNVTTVSIKDGQVSKVNSNYLFTDETDVSIGGAITQIPMNNTAKKLAKYYEQNPDQKLNTGNYSSHTYTKKPFAVSDKQSDTLFSIDGGKTWWDYNDPKSPSGVEIGNASKAGNYMKKDNPNAGKVVRNEVIGILNPMEIEMNLDTSGGKQKSTVKKQNLNFTTMSYTPDGDVLSESRKIRIMKSLKDPVVLPESKKKHKVKPGQRYKGKTNFQGMDKLIGDVKPQDPFKKERSAWSKDWQGYNARLSQEKKNAVLELVGDGKQAYNYMLNDSRIKNAEEMEKFWGLHPELYSYVFNGKKYKETRKEQVKGDYLVFLTDENGENTTMLQSDISIKLAEEHEKEMLAEYNKTAEPTPFLKDPLMKKVAKRLKNEIDYPDKPAKKGYPNQPPPKQVNGWHPEYGKTYKYDKLDPVSAVMMKRAPTGDPEIDANVKKLSLKPKVVKKSSNWREELVIPEKEENPIEEKTLFKKVNDIQEQMTTSGVFAYQLSPASGDVQNFQTGLTGDGGINFGQNNVNDSVLTGEGEYTAFSIMGNLMTAEDPTGVGRWFRHRDYDFPAGATGKQSIHGGTYATSSAIGVGAAENQVPGYVPCSMRYCRPTGTWSEPGEDPYQNTKGYTVDELGRVPGHHTFVDDQGRKGYGTALHVNNSGWFATKDIDTTEVDTIKIHAYAGSGTIQTAAKATQVYYWAGNKPGFKSVSGDTIYAGGEIDQNKPNDGWRPLNQKPDGTFDNTVSNIIIPHDRPSSTHSVLSAYTQKIPEWCRGKNSRFIIFAPGNQAGFSMTSLRFQRKSPMSIVVPLDSPEATVFLRVGTKEGDPKKRKQAVEDRLKASKQYTNTVISKDFPGMDATLYDTQSKQQQKWDSKKQEFGDVGTLDQQKEKFVSKDVKLPPNYADVQNKLSKRSKK